MRIPSFLNSWNRVMDVVHGVMSCPQPRDPRALCLHSYMDEQEALEACQEEWAAITKKKVKKSDKQAMAQR